jgi:phosphate-selective porin
MTIRLVVALALALTAAATQAADPVSPMPGESLVAFQCRAAFVPEARTCAARCDAAYAGDADARFECVHACTKRGLFDIGQCRGQGGTAAAAALVATR